MISKILNDLTNEGLTLPEDFRNFMEKNASRLFDWAFAEISIRDNTFVFNNFLGATGELNTDLYKWYKFSSDGSEYLTFGNGVYGESFAIKVKSDKIGQVVVFFDDEGELQKYILANSFSEFLALL